MAIDKKALRNELAQAHRIDFSADFHTLGSSQALALADAAKAAKYRKPKNANGSTARYFFAYLNREPKTEVQHIVQGNYGHGHGWEDLTSSTDYREARASLKDYRENDPAPTRLIRRRVAL